MNMYARLIIAQQFCSSSSMMTGKQLFKYLMRQCDKLPNDAKQFYKFTIKQSYKQHVTETDPERIQEIIKKSLDDSKWILKKYADKSQIS